MAKDPLQVNHCAEQLKALSEPVRLRIVNALRTGAQSVSDLSDSLKVELVTVSHHLQVLRNAGIVKSERNGRFIVYSLHEDVFRATGEGRASEHLDFGCCRLEIPKDPG